MQLVVIVMITRLWAVVSARRQHHTLCGRKYWRNPWYNNIVRVSIAAPSTLPLHKDRHREPLNQQQHRTGPMSYYALPPVDKSIRSSLKPHERAHRGRHKLRANSDKQNCMAPIKLRSQRCYDRCWHIHFSDAVHARATASTRRFRAYVRQIVLILQLRCRRRRLSVRRRWPGARVVVVLCRYKLP